MMEDLAQDCEELSSTLMSSFADIPMGQNSNAERLPLLPHGSRTRVPHVSVRLFEEVSSLAASPPATRRRLRGKQFTASSCNSPVITVDSYSPFSQSSLIQSMGGGEGLGRRLYEILRLFHKKPLEATVGQCFAPPPGNSMCIAKHDAQRAAFSKLPQKAKLKMAKQVVASERMPADLLPYLRILESEVPKTVSQQRIQGKCVSAVDACLLWGESLDRAEDAFCMWGGVCFDRQGAWAWVMASANRVAKTHVRIYMKICSGWIAHAGDGME
jgi:hypothetical protein